MSSTTPDSAATPTLPVAARKQFRRTLIRVMSMQLFTLLVLALIQLRYNR